jgi:Amino acid permease
MSGLKGSGRPRPAQAATAAVLLMAANTSYNDFPRVLFLMARDRQAPRSFLHIGDRLTFRNGILLLSVAAAAIYIGFGGKTGTLLPLYAVGVFLAFTLSQTGMVMHWRRHRDQPHWRRSLAFNAIGALLSGIVFVVAGVTKFTSGAWVSIVLIGGIVVICLRIQRYYDVAGQQLALRPGEATTSAALSAAIAPRADPGTAATSGSEDGGALDSEAWAAETPPRSTRAPLSRSWPWTGPPSARWRMPPHSASPPSRCTSARPQGATPET